MSLSEPPEALDATFDMHGVRFEVLPTAQRGLRENLINGVWMSASLFGAVVLCALVGAAVLGMEASFTLTTLAMIGVPFVLWVAGMTFFGLHDEGQRTERIHVRIGEGWLVLRHQNLGTTERVDLTTCASCTIVRGPDLVVERFGFEAVRIPMRGHGLPEIGWAAMAINRGIRDVRYGDEPAPESLVAMLRQPEN